jgi:hypothetical protein
MPVALCIPVPTQESFRAHWDHVRAHFGVDEFYVIGDGHLGSAAELPGFPLVVLQPEKGRHVRGVTSLAKFSHPEEATYLFGPDEGPMLPELLGGRAPDHVVYVPTDTARDMFSFVAFAIVMWDRKMKSR